MSLLTPGGKTKRLYSVGASVGNTADTAEDTLQSFTVPAGALANVGDSLYVFAAGSFAASTDTKTIRLKLGGNAICAPVGSATGQTTWAISASILKTAANAQSYGAMGTGLNASNTGTKSGTLTLTDTNTIALLVTGQNSTNSSAGSITCQVLIVDLVKA